MSAPDFQRPIELTRYMVANCYSGKLGLINSGGESHGNLDTSDAVKTAVIKKRAGGLGLILGHKAFQRPFSEVVELLNVVRDVSCANNLTGLNK